MARTKCFNMIEYIHFFQFEELYWISGTCFYSLINTITCKYLSFVVCIPHIIEKIQEYL